MKGLAVYAASCLRLGAEPVERDRPAASHAQAVVLVVQAPLRTVDRQQLQQVAVRQRKVDLAIRGTLGSIIAVGYEDLMCVVDARQPLLMDFKLPFERVFPHLKQAGESGPLGGG